MQRPTCVGVRVRTTQDAQVIFHAVNLKKLPIITRRLDNDERREIRSGCVYVWEERSPNTESIGMVGIERWTDSRQWGPSRVRDEFLYYHERDRSPVDSDSDTTLTSHGPSPPRSRRGNLIKQTYSVLVNTPRGRRKWHLTAYFTQDTQEDLHTIDNFPELASLYVPPGKYISARSINKNPKPGTYQHMGGPFPFGGHDRTSRLVMYQNRPPLWNSRGNGEQRGALAPLAYLERIAPPRRHPMDEKALMSFSCHVSRSAYRSVC